MSRSYKAYLHDMLDCMNKILEYVKGYKYDQFSNDEKTIDAVVRNIEIIGEAAKHLPDKIKNRDPQIPWKAIVGMRDKLAHDYFGVDVLFVWNTVKDDIPLLKEKVSILLDSINE